MIPIPPSRAMAMAVLASVTVSMAALTSGMFNLIFLVSNVPISAIAGVMADLAGSSSTSSNVRAS
jgi:hypothetical protein